MKKAIFACALLSALPATTFAQDATAVWTAISQPAFDAEKTASVNNLTLERDRLKFVLANGNLYFAQPANGKVYAAVFRGQGRIQAQPPNSLEAHMLRVNSGQSSLDLEFTDAIFTFADSTFDELSKQLTFSSGSFVEAAKTYNDRQKDREDVGAEILPRLLKSLLSADAKRNAFFAADVKTREKGWVHARFDALDLEEVSVGRWVNYGGYETVDTWMSFPANGRDAREAYRDPLARDDFRIKSYVIDATVNQGAELLATAKVNVEHRGSGEQVLVFELDSNLRLQSVKDEAGKTLTFFQPRDPRGRDQSYGDYVAVVLASPSEQGKTQTLEFQYTGKRVVRKEGNGNYFCQSYGWYPTRPNSFSSRADFELNFKSPKKFTLVATGNKISETTDGDWDYSVWKSDIPLAVAGFAFGDYKVVTEKAGNIDVEIYANKEGDDVMKEIQNEAEGGNLPTLNGPRSTGVSVGTLTPAGLAKPMAVEMANSLRVFESYFGPYPYKRLAVSSLPLAYSYGQGWPTLIYLWSLSFLDSQQRHSLGIRDHTQLTDFFRAHESSHQWWGHRVSWKSYHDQWLSEGFAEFSGNLYVQFRKGEKEFIARLKQDRELLKVRGDLKNRRLESLGPIWMGRRLRSVDAPSTYSFLVYTKGGYVLNMIRMMMWDNRSQTPEARFQAMMKDFTQTYHNQAASTEDFKAIVEKHIVPVMDVDGNKKLDWFFNQYVYGTGFGEYNFQYTVEPAADNRWTVKATLTRSGVPEDWKDVLPLYVTTGGRTIRLGWLTARTSREVIEIPGLPFKPERVALNVNEDILADVKQ